MTRRLTLLSIIILASGSTLSSQEQANWWDRTERTVSSQCDFSFKVTGVRQVGNRMTARGAFNTQYLETKKEEFVLYALEFECQMTVRSLKQGAGGKDAWRTTFDPAWLRVVWADISDGSCEILGWRENAEGLLLSTQSGTSENIELKGEIIFAGSSKGKKLWINFLNAPTIEIAH